MNAHLKTNDIVVVGSNMMDMITKIPRLPKMGETLAGSAFSLGFGGKGANQAVMAARLQAKVAMVTKVGGDVFGGMVKQNFASQGIAVDTIFTDDSLPSGVAPILVDDEGHNLVIIVPGANNSLSAAEVAKAQAVIESARILICQLEIPDEAILAAFEIASQAGVQIIFNPAPARPVPPRMLALADLLVPNETEAELLTGMPVGGLDDAARAAEALHAMGAKTVIITLGAQGALLYEGSQASHFQAPKVKAVDTTGSGDAFIGSLAVSLARGKSLPEAVVFANRAAALSVTRIGTQISFPTPDEIDAFTG